MANAGSSDSPASSSLDKSSLSIPPQVQYRLYKTRFVGLLAFVRPSRVFFCASSHCTPGHPRLRHWHAMGLVRSNCHTRYSSTVQSLVPSVPNPSLLSAATEFDITVNQVNWLGNILSWIFIPVSLLIPVFCARFGIARCVCPRSVPFSPPHFLPSRLKLVPS